MTYNPPTHVIAKPGDTTTMCGIPTRDALPITARAHLARHITGRHATICPNCATQLRKQQR